MLGKLKDLILYGDTDRESYEAIKNKMEYSNRIMALVFATVAFILIAVMFLLSYVIEGFRDSRSVYLFGIVFSLILVLISLLAKKYHILSYVSVYMAISVFMIYGISIATLTRPEEQTVTFMVLLIFVPLIFVERPIRMGIMLICYICLFIVMALGTKTGSTLRVDITDAVIFGLLSIVSETVVYRAKIRGYVLENRLQVMSEIDQLTGLNNRNCYEMRISMYPSMYESSICCIYIDINGLHELNNSKGHKSGDEMLCYIADEVKNIFGSKDTYRIGGDEYVAFVLDRSEKEIQEKLQLLNENVMEEGYHAAVGYKYCTERKTDINKLIVEAESEMYKSKAEYYKTHERRKR